MHAAWSRNVLVVLMILFVELLSTVKVLLLIAILISSVSLASTFRHTINELVAKVENNIVIHFTS